jgi:uncharacterized protein YlzI (FlbEa/FlbD family)
MGRGVSKLCADCFHIEPENSIPLIETLSKSSAVSEVSSTNLGDSRVEEDFPNQEYFFKIVEKASIELLSHIRCPFEEEGFVEILKKDKIRIHTKDCENGYIMKSESSINVSVDDFINLITDIKHRKLWDETIERIEVIHALPEDTTVTYVKFKKFLVVSSRDIVTVNRLVRVHNGLLYVSASCESEEFPPHENAIRAHIEASGYYVEPLNGASKVLCYTVADAGGNIPKSFVRNTAASAIPKFIASVEKTIKNKKW